MLLKEILLIKIIPFTSENTMCNWVIHCENLETRRRLKVMMDQYHIHNPSSGIDFTLYKSWKVSGQILQHDILIDYRANLLDIIDLLETYSSNFIIRLNFTVDRLDSSIPFKRLSSYYIDKMKRGPTTVAQMSRQDTKIVKTM